MGDNKACTVREKSVAQINYVDIDGKAGGGNG